MRRSWVLVVFVVGCCWLLVAGCRLSIAGCCSRLLLVVVCCWWLWLVVGCCFFLIVVCGKFAIVKHPRPVMPIRDCQPPPVKHSHNCQIPSPEMQITNTTSAKMPPGRPVKKNRNPPKSIPRWNFCAFQPDLAVNGKRFKHI